MNQKKFAQYDNFKDTELSWLGLVPSHWNLTRLKNLTKTQTGTTPQSSSSEYYKNGTDFWVRTTDLNNNHLYESEYKVTKLAIKHYGLRQIPADSVLLAMYGGMGTIGKNSFLKNEVTINQSVCAILPNKKKFNSVYFWYYIQYFRPHWEMFADSARKDPNINQAAIKRLWLILPPLVEQAAIASYLDIKTKQIDKKIDFLSQKAAQYGKLKKSLINKVVTRGLDKNAVMENSGVEWIGEVPANWKIKRIKEISDINKKTLDEKTPSFYEFDYVDIGSVTYGIKGYAKERMIFEGSPSRARRIVKKDDTIISTVRTYLKAIAVIEEDASDLIVSTGFAVISPHKKMSPKYCSYLLTSNLIIDKICAVSAGVSYPATSSTVIGNLFFLVPELLEQQAIATYLDEKTAHIDKIVATLVSQIDKLKELRKTLINDVVTGKIKVVQEGETA